MKTAQRKLTKKSKMQECDKALIDQFDYSLLSPEFSKLAKPAQRGLLNNGIRTPADLARRTVEEVTALHGIGPSAVPILRKALRENGLSFKSPRRQSYCSYARLTELPGTRVDREESKPARLKPTRIAHAIGRRALQVCHSTSLDAGEGKSCRKNTKAACFDAVRGCGLLV